MSSSTPTLRRLLEEPFGPFWHHDILDQEKCKSTPRNVLTLSNVMMACGNEPIGLTYTEASQLECADERLAQGRVLARGVLAVLHYSWFSETGLKIIQEQLNQRNTQWSIAGDGPRMKGPITLERLYNMYGQRQGPTGLHVKVLIQGVQQKPAAYMTSDLVPDGLEIYWEHQDNSHRAFEVLSLEAETYKLSRKYLARYHLVRTMRDLMNIYKEEMKIPSIPLEDLTPDWYVRQYLEHKATDRWLQTNRAIYDSDDDPDIEPHTAGKLIEGKSRKPRHVSTAEVRSLFLMHTLWLIHDQKQVRRKKSRIIDVDSWTRWFADGRRWRAEMQKEYPGMQFGVFDLEDEDEDDGNMSFEDDRAEDSEADRPSPPPRKGSKKRQRETPTVILKPASKKAKTMRRRIDSTSSGSLVASPPSRPSPGPSTPRGSRPEILLRPAHHTRSSLVQQDNESDRSYDSEFSDSEASTPPWSDSDDSLPRSRDRTPISPTLLSRIPPQLLDLPVLPWPGLTWYCPIGRCDYEINLLSLTEEQRDRLSDEDVERITTIGWTLRDAPVQLIFFRLADQHNRDHLDAQGIELVEKDGKPFTLRWKNPGAHPSTQNTSNRPRNLVVKREE